jgi:hypothetical protein
MICSEALVLYDDDIYEHVRPCAFLLIKAI